MKHKEEPKMPLQCKIDNFLWSCSFIYNVVFLPYFIYRITKGNRSGKKIVRPVLLSYFIPKDIASPATM